MKNFKPLPNLEILNAYFTYDAEQKNLLHNLDSSRGTRGDVAGYIAAEGYRKVKIKREAFSAHRVIWFMVHGADPGLMDIDHKDGDRSNNCIKNLRLATRSQNVCNSITRSDNTSGAKGVYWRSNRNKWQAEVRLDGKSHFGGRYKTFPEAEAAVIKLRKKIHGEFFK